MCNDFEEATIARIEAKESLTEEELEDLISGFRIETEIGENRRWSRTNTTIIKLKDRTFSIDWEEGLTEYQENQYYNQPIEVIGKTYEKTITITITDWIPV